MDACIDTFSYVFNNGGAANRNMSQYNGFDGTCQNQQFSSLTTHSDVGNGEVLNGHYNPNMQNQRESVVGGNTAMFSGDYLHSVLPSMSWSDRQMSISNNNGSKTSMEVSSTTGTHGYHPFSNSASAAFNLQQLHHGICSVGTMPSWQQAFAFTDCASTSVPSQNDEGNDTRIPMPLSMSSVPTSSSNTLTNGHSSSGSANNSNNNNNTSNSNTIAFLSSPQNVHCPETNGGGGGGGGGGNGQRSSSMQLTDGLQSQFNTELSFKNTVSNVGQLSSQPQNTLAIGTNPSTLSLSVSLLNATGTIPISQPSTTMKFTTSASVPTTDSSYDTSDFVKMANTPTRNVRLRTNTKLDMDRQKALEDDIRDKELQKQQRTPIQSTAVPVSQPPAVNVVVPSRVLQVTSALENPTPFHVEQTRRFKIRQYCAGFANSLPEAQGATLSLGASGPAVVPVKHSRVQHLITDGAVSSAPPNYSTTPTPLSPVSALEPAASSPGPSQRSSVATSVNDEFEDWPDFLLPDEKSSDQIQKADQVASLPQSGFNRISGIPESSSSCPADSTKEVTTPGETGKVSKDRIKKDNHNKIERKRRFHINDMITEQGRLLPRQNERHHEKIGEVKQNKGSILKASVDYTKVLKQDNDSLFQKLQKAEQEKKELLVRIQHIEQLCKQTGVQLPLDILTWKSEANTDEVTALPTPEVRIKQEPMTYSSIDDFDRNICDMMEEDRNIVTGTSDPMFGQPLETEDGFHHPEGMDFEV